MQRPVPFRSRAFTLVEVILAVLIVGVGLTAAMRALPVLLKTADASRHSLRAHRLATNLLTEISLLPYEDPNGSPVFGPETGETGPTRAGFDDIDDYRLWTESPPATKDGTLEPDGADCTRSVAVVSVSTSDFSSVVADGSSQAKRLTVTVSRQGMTPVSITAVRLKGANRED